LVEAVKGNRFQYLYEVLQQDILTVLLIKIRHWGEATPLFFSCSFINLHNLFHFILASMPVTPLIWSSVTKCSLWGFDRSRLRISFPFMRAATSTPCCRYMAFGARSVFIFPSIFSIFSRIRILYHHSYQSKLKQLHSKSQARHRPCRVRRMVYYKRGAAEKIQAIILPSGGCLARCRKLVAGTENHQSKLKQLHSKSQARHRACRVMKTYG
jgi:hypothetical protein